MERYSTNKVFVAACAGMGFFGVAMLSLAPILDQINSLVDGANGLPSTLSLGILLGTIVFGPIVDRFGYKNLLIVSSILALAGLQGLAHFTRLWLLHGSIFCLGFGGGILNGETNAVVSDIYDDDKRGGRLGILGASYCVGALIWTLLNYLIPDFRIPLNAISIVMACCIVFFIFISFPASKETQKESLSSSLGLLKYPSLLLFALVLFFESGFEGAQGNFSVSFFNLCGGLDLSEAKFAIIWFTIGMMAGRFLLGMIMKKLGNLGTLYSYLGVALVGVALMIFAPSAALAADISMVLIGFGVGATYPVILNYIGGMFREHSGTAISISMFIALIGQFLFNRFTGTAFDAGHYYVLPILMIVAEICMMIITPTAINIARKNNNTKIK